MRRPFVSLTFVLALALSPAVLFAQQPQPQPAPPPAGQPPTGQTPTSPAPAGQTPPPAAAGAPKLGFTSNAGLLLVQVKPDQTAAFEEMAAKLKAGLAATDNAALKPQAAGWKIYKSTEPMQGNALYIVLVDPAVPNAEYAFLDVLQKTMTPEQARAPETVEKFKVYAAAFAGINKLNLTLVGAQ